MIYTRRAPLVFSFLFAFTLFSAANNAADFPLDKISLPAGFQIAVFADKLPGTRFMALGDKGTLFIGTRGEGKVYALVLNAEKTAVVRKITLLDDLDEPNGVAFHAGNLYVAEVGRILKYENIETQLETPPTPQIVTDKLPDKRWHGYKVIAVGPDNQLYVSVGMPCNTCNYRDSDPQLGTIMRMKLDGSELQPYAIGIRNSMGFTWHPDTHEMWFTDNGRDLLGDDIPPDEINYAPKPGMDFGFPYVYGNNELAPSYRKEKIDVSRFTPPAWKLPAHVAPLGIKFYTGTQFPTAYQQQLFVATHGSWNRSKKVGYEVLMLTLDKNKIVKSEAFAKGWLQGEEAWGRPVDLLVLPNGRLLVSDDKMGAIYQITYAPRK